MPPSARGQPFIGFHIEHITAKQHGGSDEPENLCVACGRCNSHKKGPNLTGIDPDTGRIEPLFNPRKMADDRPLQPGWRPSIIILSDSITISAIVTQTFDRVVSVANSSSGIGRIRSRYTPDPENRSTSRRFKAIVWPPLAKPSCSQQSPPMELPRSCLKPGRSRSRTTGSQPWIRSTSRCGRAKSSACWGPTAPARRRRSTCF
ncbi:HNH endonuclease [Singulisphaera sp. GP187]|uniref:HNH endonuclease n=1 Tax=Singulisphaera sp. GP187 TaxID=1882752 RepID=UPI00396573EC